MRRMAYCMVGVVAAWLALSTAAWAGGRSLADYPLRVHIFERNAHSHYWEHSLQMVDGEGRANLYESSQPRGFDFSYRCGDRLMVSPGYETYPARWKKAGRELEIVLPVMGGKPGSGEACDLQVAMKDMAYRKHNGLVEEEPVAVFKKWMDDHQYDPEQGKNEPVRPAAAPASAGADGNN